MALQMPEGLLMYACVIADILERCVVTAVLVWCGVLCWADAQGKGKETMS